MNSRVRQAEILGGTEEVWCQGETADLNNEGSGHERVLVRVHSCSISSGLHDASAEDEGGEGVLAQYDHSCEMGDPQNKPGHEKGDVSGERGLVPISRERDRAVSSITVQRYRIHSLGQLVRDKGHRVRDREDNRKGERYDPAEGASTGNWGEEGPYHGTEGVYSGSLSAEEYGALEGTSTRSRGEEGRHAIEDLNARNRDEGRHGTGEGVNTGRMGENGEEEGEGEDEREEDTEVLHHEECCQGPRYGLGGHSESRKDGDS